MGKTTDAVERVDAAVQVGEPEAPHAGADEVAEQLKRLGAELQAVADDQVARAEKLREVESVLGRLRVRDFPELAESPVIQRFVSLFAETEGMRPGEVRNRGTLAQVEREWSMGNIQAEVQAGRMALKRFVPNESLPLTFNGVTLFVSAGEECEVPECFYDIYRNRQHALRQARVNEAYLLGQSDMPPDRNWMTDEAATVRAWSTQGQALGKRSGHIGVGPIFAGDEATGENGAV